MRSIFSKFVLAPVVLAAAALVTTSATAESIVKVPFNFTVGSKALPAGDYAVVHESSTGFVTLIRRGSSDIYTWTLGPGGGSKEQEQRRFPAPFSPLLAFPRATYG